MDPVPRETWVLPERRGFSTRSRTIGGSASIRRQLWPDIGVMGELSRRLLPVIPLQPDDVRLLSIAERPPRYALGAYDFTREAVSLMRVTSSSRRGRTCRGGTCSRRSGDSCTSVMARSRPTSSRRRAFAATRRLRRHRVPSRGERLPLDDGRSTDPEDFRAVYSFDDVFPRVRITGPSVSGTTTSRRRVARALRRRAEPSRP